MARMVPLGMASSLFENPQEWGAQIKKVRRAAGVSQEDLAERVGVSKSTVNRWENGGEDGSGRSVQRRRAIAAAVAEVLRVPGRELGLSNGPDEDSRVEATLSDLAALETKLLSRLGEVRDDLEDVRTQLTLLAHDSGESGRG